MFLTKKLIRNAAFIASAATFATICATSAIPASAYIDPTCNSYGFNVDMDYYKDIRGCTYLNQTVYFGNQILGTTTTTMLFCTQKQKVGAKNMNVAMYHTTLSPRTVYGYTGYSDLLEYRTVLPRWSQDIVTAKPENVAGSSSYSIGYGGGLTGSVDITQNRLQVTNYSDNSQKLYRVEYDYRPALFDWDSTNNYLKGRSEQRGTLYYTTDGLGFQYPLTVKVTFNAFSPNIVMPTSNTCTWNITGVS